MWSPVMALGLFFGTKVALAITLTSPARSGLVRQLAPLQWQPLCGQCIWLYTI